MLIRDPQPAPKGSWRWAVRVAEATAWGMVGLLLVLLHIASIDDVSYRRGLVLAGVFSAWLLALFHLLLSRLGARRWILWGSVLVDLSFACAVFALLRQEVDAAQLFFVPVIVASGLLGRPPLTLLGPAISLGGFYATSLVTGEAPSVPVLVLTGGVFLLSGGVAGLLARELREHYRGERAEHALAATVGHRLTAVVEAVDQAIVFSDPAGITQLINRRAAELFDISPDEHLGMQAVQLLRTLARRTEDPEGFMETFQDLRDDPAKEIRTDVEQIIPEIRKLRLYSSPAFDEDGALLGRIDVYTDVTDSARRAEEVERLYEVARLTAESYQRSLLPDTIPSLPRVSFVAHYVPAAGRRGVCGDFYDFLNLPDGRAGVVLGDVCGVGPTAVGDGALTRYTLESFAGREAHPGKLLEMMNAYLYEQVPPDRFVRVLLGVLDPERAIFEYANAGHVPPIIFQPRTGEVSLLGEGGIALAVEDDTDYKVGRIELEPGDTLLLYTDGITEASREGEPFGQGRLLDLVKKHGAGTPGEVSQAIRRAVDAWVGNGESCDDIAILVCQVVTDSIFDERTRELVLPNETSRLREMREFVHAFLADLRAPVNVSSEILLAANEAAANACKYGKRSDARSEIRIRCALEGTNVLVEVADDGAGFDSSTVNGEHLPDRYASGGRGLFLMRRLMDRLSIDSSEEGTTVAMAKKVFASHR